jgi:glycosyltransferase involved in cell wall biosynthesis
VAKGNRGLIPRDAAGLALTVITPSLNHGEFVGTAVDSAIPRADIPFEHLVIDGGSTDATASVLADRPRLRVLVRPDLDSHEAMNLGLEIARGEVIGFLSCDDRYDPGALDAVVDYFNGNPTVEALCGTARQFITRDGREQEVCRFPHTGQDNMMLELTFGNPAFNSWFFRRSLLRRLGGFRVDFRLAADRDFQLRVAANTTPVVLPRLLYQYRCHPGSRTMDPRGTNRLAMIMDHIDMAQKQSMEVWPDNTAVRSLLANWAALERFKLFIWALRNRTVPLRDSLANMPWHRVPAALLLRRRWLRILSRQQDRRFVPSRRPSRLVARS